MIYTNLIYFLYDVLCNSHKGLQMTKALKNMIKQCKKDILVSTTMFRFKDSKEFDYLFGK